MPYLRFKIPEMASAPATVATFATVSGPPRRGVASVASVAAERRDSDIQPVATAAAVASPPSNYETRAPTDLREMYEERAAIMEYDAGVSRAEAEAAAWSEIFRTSTLLDLTNSLCFYRLSHS